MPLPSDNTKDRSEPGRNLLAEESTAAAGNDAGRRRSVSPEREPTVSQPIKCKEMVWSRNGWQHYQCSRNAVRDGYCKQHHPDAAAKRDAESRSRATAKWKQSPRAKLGQAQKDIARMRGLLSEAVAHCEQCRGLDVHDARRCARCLSFVAELGGGE